MGRHEDGKDGIVGAISFKRDTLPRGYLITGAEFRNNEPGGGPYGELSTGVIRAITQARRNRDQQPDIKLREAGVIVDILTEAGVTLLGTVYKINPSTLADIFFQFDLANMATQYTSDRFAVSPAFVYQTLNLGFGVIGSRRERVDGVQQIITCETILSRHLFLKATQKNNYIQQFGIYGANVLTR